MRQRQYEGGTWRILAYNIDGNCLKSVTEKRKTVEFRKRISAKTAVFSAFKSVSRSKKSDDTLYSQGVVLCSHVDKGCVS